MGREQVPYIMRKHATCGNKMKKEVGWKRTSSLYYARDENKNS